MATIEVAVLNEDRRPLKGVTVEAIHGTTLAITATAVTGDNGIAVFNLTTEHFFRPRVRRTSVTVGDQTFTGEVEVQIVSGGLGPVFCDDYLISRAWLGTAGQVFTSLTGDTFKVYRSIQPAVDDAESRQASGDLADSVALAICPGRYSETVILGATAGLDSSNQMILYAYHGLAPTGGVGHTTGAVSIGIANSTVAAIDIVDGTQDYILEGLNLDTFTGGLTSGFSLDGSGTNVSGEARNCKFGTKVSGDFAGWKFINCQFSEAGYTVPSGKTPSTVTFDHCKFNGGSQMVWSGGVQQHYFQNCMFVGSLTTILINGGVNTNITFDSCDLSTGTTPKQFMTVNGSTTVSGLKFVGGCDMGSPGLNAVIYIESPAIVRGLIVVGNTWAKVNGNTTPYIRSTADSLDVTGAVIEANSFGFDGFGDLYIETEDPTKASVVGNFDESIFGPNAPGTIVQYDIIGVRNEFYPPSSDINTGGSGRQSWIHIETYIPFGSVQVAIGP